MVHKPKVSVVYLYVYIHISMTLDPNHIALDNLIFGKHFNQSSSEENICSTEDKCCVNRYEMHLNGVSACICTDAYLCGLYSNHIPSDNLQKAFQPIIITDKLTSSISSLIRPSEHVQGVYCMYDTRHTTVLSNKSMNNGHICQEVDSYAMQFKSTFKYIKKPFKKGTFSREIICASKYYYIAIF